MRFLLVDTYFKGFQQLFFREAVSKNTLVKVVTSIMASADSIKNTPTSLTEEESVRIILMLLFLLLVVGVMPLAW